MDEAQRRAATASIDRMFNELAEKLLSGRPGPSTESLPGLFHVASGERTPTSIRILKPYLESLKHHLDARSSAAKADVLRALADQQPEVALRDATARIEDGVKRVLETEATALRNAGSLAGVARRAEDLGIEDPTIVFIVHRIGACPECVRLHLMGSGEPRAWLQSELGSGYHKKGDEFPKIGGLHPNCRCSLVMVPPGYGFRGGRLAFISRDYSLIADQRQSSAA